MPVDNKRSNALDSPLYVTKPFLPPMEEYINGMSEIWDRKQLTNNGPILKRFTKEMSRLFETDDVCLFNNGTLALQIGLQGLGLKGEVITTPFTFPATSHALSWNNIQPVFCDIEPEYYTLDPEKIEAAITPDTTAILAVHVFGHPCQHDPLSDIAKRHDLKLIYDSAHAFGVKVDGKSIAHMGDLSMFSFHATKLFHSIEGGMLVTEDKDLRKKVNYLKNFGFKNETEVVMTGTNAKMNEMQALMGSCVLRYLEEILISRKLLSELYRIKLDGIPGISTTPDHKKNIDYNYAYFTIEVDENSYGMSRDHLYETLKSYNVYTRRYFYPLLSDLECYRSIPQTQTLDIAREIASKILVLPLYPDLDPVLAQKICDIIIEIHESTRK